MSQDVERSVFAGHVVVASLMRRPPMCNMANVVVPDCKVCDTIFVFVTSVSLGDKQRDESLGRPEKELHRSFG